MLDTIYDGVNFCVTVKGVNFSASPLQTMLKLDASFAYC